MTEIQQIVVNARIGMGYKVLGYTQSHSTASRCAVLQKGRHLMSINCLGYDEHIPGVTYNLFEEE